MSFLSEALKAVRVTGGPREVDEDGRFVGPDHPWNAVEQRYVFLVRDRDREALEAFQPRVKLSTFDVLLLSKLPPGEFVYLTGRRPDHLRVDWRNHIHWTTRQEEPKV